MTEINLRDYIREIEKQLDAKRYDEAIAHCHHVLRFYPKYVDVYRLLGKAFLESQRLGDATDIFQRVLSAIPDDFVAHAGMSIIHEDEGNLDEAIWHMERAFDVQPANNAIQEELRRMYGRRDNVEPPKIRLTRGALARMYDKGELYPQAIAETRAALAESPDRLDLKSLLARIYFEAGQKVEAADIATQVLRKLPNSLVANRILFEIVMASEPERESSEYLQRLVQLDPYYKFVSEQAPAVETVPDAAIRIDKLDWKLGQAATGREDQPVWAASLGVDLGDATRPGEDKLPDWLSGTSEAEGEAQSKDQIGAPVFATGGDDLKPPMPHADDSSAAAIPDDQIPDWMKDLGWAAASPESHEAQPAAIEGFEDEIASAELPDWLQSIAPQTADAGETAGDAEATIDAWLVDRSTEADLEPASGDAVGSEATLTEDGGGLPDWLRELGEEPGVTEGENQPQSALPDWLLEADESPGAKPEEAAEPVEAETIVPAFEFDLPDWLAETKESIQTESVEAEPVEAGPAPAALPDWPVEQEGQPLEAEAVAANLPDWLLEAEESFEDMAPEAEPVGAHPAKAELPDWLLEAEEPTQVGSSATEPDEAQPLEAELPDWLLETADTAPLEPVEAEAVEARAVEAELPEWLLKTEEPAEAEAIEGMPVDAALPDWLRETEEITPVESIEAEAVEARAVEAELPDWLLETEEPAEAEAIEGMPVDAALPDWLRETEETAPVESIEAEPVEAALPDWLIEAEEPAQAEAIIEGLPVEGSLPDWLLEAKEAAKGEPAEAEALEPVLPEWLLETEEPVRGEAGEVEPVGAQPVEAALPDWLLESEASSGDEAIETEPVEASLPGWLQEAEEPAEVEESGKSALPDWLLATEDRAEDRSVEAALPDWLLETDKPVETEPSAMIESQPAEVALPDWLLEAKESTEAEPVDAEPVEAEAIEAAMPDWLSEAEAAEAEIESIEVEPVEIEPGEAETVEAALPDWLLETEDLVEIGSTEAGTLEAEPVDSALPDWLLEAQAVEEIAPSPDLGDTKPTRITSEDKPAPESESAELEDAFSWLATMLAPQEIAPQAALTEATTGEPVESVPAPSEPLSEPGLLPVDDDAAFAWLESLAVRQGASEALLLTPEERAETPPEWVQQAAETVTPPIESPPEAAPEAVTSKEPATAAEIEVEAISKTEDAAAGLVQLEREPSLAADEERIAEPVAEEPPAHETVEPPPSDTAGAFPTDDDAAFAWLESLAIRQGANEALLLTPEERMEAPPDWVQRAAAETETAAEPAEAEPIEVQPSEAESAQTEPVEAALPEWLLETETTEQIPPAESVEAIEVERSEAAVPEWLLEVEEIDKLAPAEPVEAIEDERVETSIPDWLLKAEETAQAEPAEPVETIAAERAEAVLPEWLLEAEEASETQPVGSSETGPVEAIEVIEPEPVEAEAAFADRRALEEIPELPDWLSGSDEAAPDEPIDWELPAITRRRYDLNRITMIELERLPGVGFILAQRIIDYREAHGPFKSLEDLLEIPDFTDFNLSSVRANLYITEAETPAAVSPPVAESAPAPYTAEVPGVQETPDSAVPEPLQQARRQLAQGDLETALEAYNDLIRSNEHLALVVEDLNAAVRTRPEAIDVWQSLGDAYFRTNQLKEAVHAYAQAEKLLR